MEAQLHPHLGLLYACLEPTLQTDWMVECYTYSTGCDLRPPPPPLWAVVCNFILSQFNFVI